MARRKEDEISDDLSSCLLVSGLPIIPAEKVKKLSTVLLEKLAVDPLKGEKRKPMFIHMPTESSAEGEVSKGYCMVDYGTVGEVDRAISKHQNFALDKKHSLKLQPFTDFEWYNNIPEEYSPPEEKKYEPKRDMWNWLMDPQAREQYLVRFGEELEVTWHDPLAVGKATPIQKRQGWAESYTRWSPLGTYLCTFHQKGIQLHGGDGFIVLGRYNHKDVQLSDFSPKEKFLVTWNGKESIVWDIKAQKPKRTFPGGQLPNGPPVFKWTSDEKYFLRMIYEEDGLLDAKGGKDDRYKINVYDSETMQLLKTTPCTETVKSCEWSPTDYTLSYWIPEQGEKPARVVITRLTPNTKDETVEFKDIVRKNLFRVDDIKMHWQSSGDFLCVKVDRWAKGVAGDVTKKTKITSFELFRMKAKDVPVESVDLKDQVIAFAWEPNGVRFAVIHGDNSTKRNVSLYSMLSIKTGTPKLLKTLENRAVNSLFWSPKGTNILLSTLRSQGAGTLEFWNVNTMDMYAQQEHFMVTDVDWDPTGRYVCTYISHFIHSMESNFVIWNFQGKEVMRVSRQQLYQFYWRPRPPSLLTEQKQKTIQKTLKERIQLYEQEELSTKRQQDNAESKQRKAMLDAFNDIIMTRRQELEEAKVIRRKCRGYDSDDDSNCIIKEMIVEEVISVVEEVVP